MVKLLGYHDAYASGVIHAIAGGTALGVLVHLGPRIGKFRPDGTPRNIVPHNPWLVTIGLFLIYAGFWGFYVACNVPIIARRRHRRPGCRLHGDHDLPDPDHALGDHGQFPDVALGRAAGRLHRLQGRCVLDLFVRAGRLIACSAGNDLYHPLQALIIAAIGVVIIYKLHFWVERTFKIDDAVGAVAVHGYAGFYGVVIAGFVLWGTPSSAFEGYAAINPLGQLVGAVIMFGVLGFLPAWILCAIFKAAGMLRIPREIELVGLDIADYHGRYLDEDEVRRAEVREAEAAGILRQAAPGE